MFSRGTWLTQEAAGKFIRAVAGEKFDVGKVLCVIPMKFACGNRPGALPLFNFLDIQAKLFQFGYKNLPPVDAYLSKFQRSRRKRLKNMQ